MNRPLILHITCHDLGCHLGTYGQRTVRSPNLDAFGKSGTVFTRAFATAPQCSPARASMSCGEYPHECGMLGLAHPPFLFHLAEGTPTIARVLGEAGYETHLFGLQHIAPTGEDAGFRHVHPYPGSAALGADVAEQVEAFLGGDLPLAPLYLEVNIEETHRPYGQGGALPDRSLGVAIPPYLPQDAPSEVEIAALQGAIIHADDAVGRLSDAVARSSLGEDAVIAFASDHGIAMPRAKCTLYDPGIEVALMFRGPGVPAGVRVDGLVSGIDVAPTLLELGGVERPPVKGRSLVPMFTGGTGRDAVFSEQTYHSYYDPLRAVRTRKWKLIVNFGVGFQVQIPADIAEGPIMRNDPARYGAPHPLAECYDLENDPWEQVNLIDETDCAETISTLSAFLLGWMKETGDPLLALTPLSPPQQARALAFLGA